MDSYLYANGIIKSLENSLLDNNKLFKLKGASEKELISKLSDLGYTGNTSSLEAMISDNMTATRNVIDSISPNKELTALFNLTIDSQNVKIIYKSKYFFDSVVNDCFLVPDCTFDLTKLKKVILENKREESFNPLLPKDQFTLIDKIDEKVKNASSKEMSNIIDNCLYSYALSKLKIGPSSLKKYLKAKIDFTNIISFYRAKALGLDEANFNSVLLDGGLISVELIKANYQLNDSNKVMKSYQEYYQGKISATIKGYENSHSLDKLEDDFERLTLNIMRENKNDSFDIGPLIYYYLEKKAEAQNIKTLFVRNVDSPRELLEF